MQKCLTHPNGHFFIPLSLLSQPLENPLTPLPPPRNRCGRVPQTAKPSANWRTKRVRCACANMSEHKQLFATRAYATIAHHPHNAPCPLHADAQNHTMILEPAAHDGRAGHALECLLGFGMRTAANKPNHGHIPSAGACQLGKCGLWPPSAGAWPHIHQRQRLYLVGKQSRCPTPPNDPARPLNNKCQRRGP